MDQLVVNVLLDYIELSEKYHLSYQFNVHLPKKAAL